MRTTLILLLSLPLFFSSCEDAENLPPAPCADGFRVGQEIELPDGTNARLEEVLYARCPCNVQCFVPREAPPRISLSYEGALDTIGFSRLTLDSLGRPVQIGEPFVAGDYTIRLLDIEDGLDCDRVDEDDVLEQGDYCVSLQVDE